MAEVQPEEIPVPNENVQLQWFPGVKPPPFPFNLDSHIICCGIIACVVLGNLEAQYQWALSYGLWHFLAYISSRAFQTLCLAICSQVVFKYFVEEPVALWNYISEYFERHMLTLVARLWSIPIDPDMEGDPADQLLGLNGELPRAVWELISGGFLLVLRLVWLVVLLCLFWGLEKLWALILGLLTFLNEYNVWLDYTPGTDDIWISARQLGGQVAMQLVIATMLFLVMFLLRAKALFALTALQDEALGRNLGFWVVDLRGTAIHLVSYTAYQVNSFIVAANRLDSIRAAKWTWSWSHVFGLGGGQHDSPGRQFLEYVGLSVAMGILAMTVHLAVRVAIRTLIKLCSSVWARLILWKTMWTGGAVRLIMGSYLSRMDHDFSLIDALEPMMMTLLFGDSGPLSMGMPEELDEGGMW